MNTNEYVDAKSMITMALAAGATAVFRPNQMNGPASQKVVVGAYQLLKEMIETRYEQVDVDLLDIGPGSVERQEVVASQLEAAGAADDEAVLRQAQAVLDIIAEKDPAALWASDKQELLPDSQAPISEVVSLDMGEEGEETADLDEETTLELLEDALEEKYAQEVSWYTDSQVVQEEMEGRQALNQGKEKLLEELEEHHAKTPVLSGGDLDAAWDEANVGEETVGGMAPTPDQDMVDEIGAAFGLSYEDDEPLHTGEKIAARDRYRWELDSASAEEEE